MADASAENAPGSEDAETTVCFCHNVSRWVIKQAIAAGADTLEKIQAETCASTGCGGCQFEVEQLLQDELEAGAKAKAESA